MPNKTREELAEIGKNTRFKSGTQAAKDAGRKGGQMLGVNNQKRKIIREAILQALTPEKLERIASNAVQRAEKYDQSFTILNDIVDGKPKATTEIQGDIGLTSAERSTVLEEAAAALRRQWSEPAADTETVKE